MFIKKLVGLLFLAFGIQLSALASTLEAQGLPFQDLPGNPQRRKPPALEQNRALEQERGVPKSNPFETKSALEAPSQNETRRLSEDAQARSLDVISRKLPDVRTESPVLITAADLPDFSAFLSQGLNELIKRGQLSIALGHSVPASDFRFSSADTWEGFSAGKNVALTETTGLGADTYIGKGFLFGSAEDLQERLNDPQLAYKLLWNSQGVWWYMGAFQASLQYRYYEGSREFRSLEGGLVRSYPRRLDPKHRSEQLFRELLYFSEPEQVKGYSWLTMRFLGDDRDRVSVYSNILQSERQLTSSNRSDPLPGAVVSPDDLFGYSGAVQTSQATFSAIETVFVPVPLFQPIFDGEQDACFRSHLKDSSVHLPYRSTAEAGGSDQVVLSHNVVFTPKKVWRLQLGWGDPYSLYPRQILYLDYDSMLPLIKEVYDQENGLMKVIVSSYGSYESSEGIYPIPMATMVYDVPKKRAAVIEYKTFQWCPKGLSGISDNMLYPGQFYEAVQRLIQTTAVAKEETKETPQAEEASRQDPAADDDYLQYDYEAPLG